MGTTKLKRAVMLVASIALALSLTPASAAFAAENSDRGGVVESIGSFFAPVAEFFGFGNDAEVDAIAAGDDAEVDVLAAGDESVVVDPSTSGSWQDYIFNDTQNVGRIWNDKSVDSSDVTLSPSNITVEKGNSDFLVSLSTLSSMSNTTTTVARPVDIVMVLDGSGSMDYDFGATSSVYLPTYSVSGSGPGGVYNGNVYYALVDGQYVQIDAVTRDSIIGSWLQMFDHWELNGQRVEAATSPDGVDAFHVQFYEYVNDSTRKAALQVAVSNFIDKTAEMNAGISDPTKKIKLAMVSFSGGSNTLQDLVDCEGTGATLLKGALSELDAGGATRADSGMQTAEGISSGRENAQKVVIFFTDGTPTSGNSFEANVANGAIASAHTMKNAGAMVYSVGVFEGADPNNTSSNENGFMHGVSSNYPDATAYNSLGARAEGSSYYSSADNPDALNQVFEGIFNEVSAGSGAPTDVPAGFDAAHGGYISFTDQLGDYMKVDNFKSVVFANEEFTDPSKSTEGNVDTYVFEGSTTTPIYPNGNLHDMIITVERSSDLATGDKVTVRVPASLIPVRAFNVDVDANTMEVSEAYPLRVFYGVSLKENVAKALGTSNVDSALSDEDYAALEAYVRENLVDGKAAFYSNAYSGMQSATNSSTIGDTVASFTPSPANSFYFFTEDTPVFADDACTQSAKRSDLGAGKTLYYKWNYVEKSGSDGYKDMTEVVAIPGDGFEVNEGYWYTDSQGDVYINAGAPHLTRTHDHYHAKDNNSTNTATDAQNPMWSQANTVIESHLGNNGRLAVELPATLSVTKEITVPDGFNAADFNGVDFEFSIAVDGAANNTYKAKIVNAEGEDEGNTFDLKFADGVATCMLHPGEALYVYGLNAGAAYEVTEQNIPDGFTQGETKGNTGKLAANVVSAATFVNNYSAAPTESAAMFSGTKAIENRDFQERDGFTFRIGVSYSGTATLAELPLPSNTVRANGTNEGLLTINPTQGTSVALDFGQVSFAAPGTYSYTIEETDPQSSNGVTTSNAQYVVTVEVTDNHNGALSAQASAKRTYNDAGDPAAEGGEAVDALGGIAFTNIFNAESVDVRLLGVKQLTDASGSIQMQDDMFRFQLRPTGSNAAAAPMPANTQGEAVDRVSTVGNTGSWSGQSGAAFTAVAFNQLTVTQEMVGQTFTYEMTEVTPANPLAGMEYDTRVNVISLAVTQGNDGVIQATVTYPENAAYATFANTYSTAPVTLDGDSAIGGTKTLNGRAMDEGEFSFTLTPTQATRAAIEAGYIQGIDAEGLTAQAPDANAGQEATFFFDGLTFTHVGIYEFTLQENVPQVDEKGVEYDRHVSTVTIEVSNNAANAELEALVGYGSYQGRAGNAFVNTYTASMSYGTAGGLNVSKTLNGRTMELDEFAFSIAGTQIDGSVAADEANAKLASTDENFTNSARRASGTALDMNKMTGVYFTQADAGKTFAYEVRETAGSAGGVTYDDTVYTVAIRVMDNGDGTMYTVTTVTNSAGGDSVVVDSRNAEAAAPSTPFVNTYKAASVDVAGAEIAGIKVLDGRDGKEGETFGFALSYASGAQDGYALDGSAQAEVGDLTNGTPKGFTFDGTTLTFSKTGTYTFNVNEVSWNGDAIGDVVDRQGMTFDRRTATVTMTVTDPGDGQLRASVGTRNMTFINTYEPVPTTFNITEATNFYKQLDGRDWLESDSFTFEMTSEDGAPMPEGTEGNVARVTLGGETHAKGATVPVTFADITYTQADLAGELSKTFFYTVTEVSPTTDAIPGMSYSGADFRIDVTVIDNQDGTMSASAKVFKTEDEDGEAIDPAQELTSEENAVFFNIYQAQPVTLSGQGNFQGTKTIEGRGALANESFGFTLSQGSVGDGGDWSSVTFAPTNGEAQTFESASATATMNGEASAVFWFDGEFSFSQTGTYVFNVAETQHNGSTLPEDGTNGMTYDRHTGTITVTVTDNYNTGQLEATVTPGTVSEDDVVSDAVENDLTFENGYMPTPAVYGAGDTLLGGHKFINDTSGSYELEANTFDFIMRSQNAGNPMPDGLTVTTDNQNRSMVTVKNSAANGSVYDFGTITFDKSDMAGATDNGDGTLTKTFQYNVFEGVTTAAGISKDNSAYTVTFTVTESQTAGTMSVEASAVKIVNTGDGSGNNEQVAADVNALDFTNTYDPTEIKGYQNIFKTLSGRNWQAGDTFTFDIAMTATELDGETPLDVATSMVSSAGTSAQLSERQSTNDGHGLSYTATINPSSSATGNTYRFSTGEIAYTHVGVYTWTVSEQDSTVASVVSDDTEYTVTVTITDEGGALKRDVVVEPALTEHGGQIGDTLDFTNVYTTSGALTGDEAIKVTKDFTGRVSNEWLDADSFTAMLTAQASVIDGQSLAADNVPMPNGRLGGIASIELTKDAHENVAFGDIAYTRPGTYNYALTEVAENMLEGVTYSAAQYNVVVTAVDNGDGTMGVTSAIQKVNDDDGTALAPAQDVDVATFANTYAASPATLDGVQSLTVEKVLTGRDWVGTDSFTFVLTAAEGNPAGVTMPQNAGGITVNGSTASHKAAFDDITFTQVGTYAFYVNEQMPEDDDAATDGVQGKGVTYDGAQRTIVVNVTDDTRGNLVATVDDASDELTFTNAYNVAAVTLTGDSAIKVQKTVDNRAWADGEEFGFTIAPAEGSEGAPMPEEDTLTMSAPADGATNTVQFGDIVYAEPGTYTYVVTENVPAGDAADASMIYDTHAGTVRVSVVENQTEGKLEIAEVHYDNADAPNEDDQYVDNAVAFTNVHQPETTFDLTGTKNLDGRAFVQGDSFTFNVASEDGAPLPDGLDENGNVTINPSEGESATIDFGTITFNSAGEYVYHITEQQGEADGMTYDTNVHNVVVNVTDDGEGNLTAALATQTEDNLAWTNMWVEAFVPGDPVSLTGTKTLTGRELAEGQFTFLVEPQDGAPMGNGMRVVFNDMSAKSENGAWSAPINLLSGVTFDEPGEYIYLISEVDDGQPGVTYDGAQYRVTYTVTQDGTATPKIERSRDNGQNWIVDTAVAFNNVYTSTVAYNASGVGGLDVTKVLNGRDMTAGQFAFTVASEDEAALAKIGGEAVTMLSAAASAGTAASVTGNPFNGIVFDSDDSGKSFVYTIDEVQESGAGYTCDTSVYTVTIMPHDNGDGTMSITTSVVDSDGEHNMTVENATTNAPRTAVVPFDNTYAAEGEATLVAHKTLENDDIANYAGMFHFIVTSGDVKVAEGTNAADGTVTFGDIEYTSANLYAAAHGGSDKVGTATLSVTDDADVYTFNYNVAEDATNLPKGVSYESGNGTATVTVTDNRAGELSISVAYDNGGNGFEFVNVYGASGQAQLTLTGNKSIVGIDGAIPPVLAGGMFGFTITGSEGAPIPDVTYVENAGATVEFGPITYTMENVFGTVEAAGDDEVTEAGTDEAAGVEVAAEGIEPYTAGRTKTFTYTVTEDAAKTVPGVTNDATAKTVDVTVTDNGDGTLTAEVTRVSAGTAQGMDFSFVNTYSVTPIENTPTGEGGLTITKVWDKQGGSRELAAGDFSFAMLDADGNVVSEGTNDAEGNVAMSPVRYTAEGQYTYKLIEVVPDDAKPVEGGYEKDGVFYVANSYVVTANVADNHDGTLGITWTMKAEDGTETDIAEFVNVYSVNPTSVTFGAAKSLEGRAMKAGEFEFELKDADGNVLGTAKNAVDGSIVFSDAIQTFGSVGEYDFTVSEVLPADDDAATEGIQKDGVTYDETVYTVHVVTADDGRGNLEITELTYDGKAELPVFRNTYVEPVVPETPATPDDPDSKNPEFAQTNDSTPWTIILGVAAVAAAGVAIGAIGIARNRRR